MQEIRDFFCCFLTYLYFGLRPKVLSLEKEKKNEFSFCFFLAYSYLCTKFRKYGKKKMALQGRATAHGAGQAHHVFGE